MSIDSILGILNEDLDKPSKPAVVKKLGYVHEPDKITLSYSRLNTLRSCPRKFLIKELNQRASHLTSIDTAYGSAFGAAVQAMFLYNSLDRAFLAALAEWDFEEFQSPYNNKKEKSFWACLASIEMFWHSEFPAISAEYELAYIEGKPGIELFVYMDVGGSYSYQVHVDLVLANREDGALAVAEIKTSGSQHQEASWGNADQTLGYFGVLDFISKKYGYKLEPRIIYITQTTGKYTSPEENYGFHTFVFEKPLNLALEFAKNIVVDIQTIELYIDMKHFPKRGSSCVSYNRACEFYGMCDGELLTTGGVNAGAVYDSLTLDDVDFHFNLQELIAKL